MNVLRKIARSIDWLSLTIGHGASYIMLIILATSLFEIVSRYFFGSPTIWSFELGQMLFGVYFLLMAAMTLQKREHVTMDIVCSHLSKRQIAILNCATFVFVCLFCGVFMYEGWKFAAKSMSMWERSTSAWRPYIWPYKMAIPVAAGLLFLQGVSNFIKDACLALTGAPLLPEEADAEKDTTGEATA